MTNPYYTEAFTGTPGQTARVNQVRSELQAIEVAFDNIDTVITAIDASIAALEAATNPTTGDIKRAIRAPIGETMAELVAAASRANKFIQFDATGLIPQMVSGAPVDATPLGTDGSVQLYVAGALGSDSTFKYNLTYKRAEVGVGGVLLSPYDTAALVTVGVPLLPPGIANYEIFWSKDSPSGFGINEPYVYFSGIAYQLRSIPVRPFDVNATSTNVPLSQHGNWMVMGNAGDQTYVLPDLSTLPTGGKSMELEITAVSFDDAPHPVYKILASGSDVIKLPGALGVWGGQAIESGPGGYIRTSVEGASVRLRSYSNSWYVVSASGPWTMDAPNTIVTPPGHSLVKLAANTTLTSADSGNTITNQGAAGNIDITLPPAVVGETAPIQQVSTCMRFGFAVYVSFYLKVKCATGDVIYDGNTPGAVSGYMRSNAGVSALELRCISTGIWAVFNKTGVWTMDS